MHVYNRDILTSSVAAAVAGVITSVAQFMLIFGGGDRRNANPLAIIATALLAPLAASLIQMAISRTREYAADRLGAEITGHPEWLASALSGLERAAHAIPNDVAERNPATAHLFIVNPLSGARMDNLFSTHPATENRIAALMELARATGQSSVSRSRSDPAQPAHGPWGGGRRSGPWG
jgi:heat shock protein HtpX